MYFIDTEGGASLPHYTQRISSSGGKSAYLGKDNGADDFDVVIGEIRKLATVKHPYRTLVVDSFSKLFNRKVAESTEAMIRSGERIAFNSDRKEAVNCTRRVVQGLDRLDMNVLLVCHSKDKWAKNEVTGVTFDAWDRLEYELDLVLEIFKCGPSRLARVVKSRLPKFEDRDTFDLSYDEFAKRWGKSVIEAEPTPPQLATPEQIQELNRALTIVPAMADVIAKIKDRYAVTDFSELSQDDIAKCIARAKEVTSEV